MRGVACTRHEERSSALLITVQPAAMMRTEAEEGERAAGDLVVQERWRQFESEIERKALKKVVYAPIYNAHWSCSPPSAPFPARVMTWCLAPVHPCHSIKILHLCETSHTTSFEVAQLRKYRSAAVLLE